MFVFHFIDPFCDSLCNEVQLHSIQRRGIMTDHDDLEDENQAGETPPADSQEQEVSDDTVDKLSSEASEDWVGEDTRINELGGYHSSEEDGLEEEEVSTSFEPFWDDDDRADTVVEKCAVDKTIGWA